MALTNETNERAEIGKKIVEALYEAIFAAEGTPIVTHKAENGKYSNKPLAAGAEFMLVDSYVGKRGHLIFVFDPADGQTFKIELEVKKVDDVFGTFGPEAAEALGIDNFTSTANLVAHLARNHRKDAEAQKEAARVKELDAKKNHYANNPNFGRF